MNETETFLRLLFGHPSLEGQFICIFTLPDAGYCFFELPKGIPLAAERCLELAESVNVYVGVCTLAEIPDRGRGTADTVGAMVGTWADIDIKGPAHSGENLVATWGEAVAHANKVGVPPSIIIASGYGLQAWWLFTEPLLITSPEIRAKAKALSKRWALSLGWAADKVHDLARVLRVPGTLNHKLGQTKPVEISLCRIREADALASQN